MKDTKRAGAVMIVAKEVGRYTIGFWGDVGIVHWQHQADPSIIQRVHKALEALVEKHPRGVSFVHVIQDGAGLPDPDTRRAITEMMASFAGPTVCVAVVLMGAGFWASALQSLLTGMRMVAPPRAWTMRFASRPSELRNWLPQQHMQRTQQYIDPSELDAAIAAVISASESRAGAVSAQRPSEP